MSKWEKLIKRISSLPKDVRFDELQKILESYGYEMRGAGKGISHFTFRKKGYPPIIIPKDEPIKRAYVKKVHDVIEIEANDEN